MHYWYVMHGNDITAGYVRAVSRAQAMAKALAYFGYVGGSPQALTVDVRRSNRKRNFMANKMLDEVDRIPPWMRVKDGYLVISRCDFLYRSGKRNETDYAAMNERDGDIYIRLAPDGNVDNSDLAYIIANGL